MQIRYPDYYQKFTCLAGNCPDTCCAGWEITIDKETAKKYREFSKKKTAMGKKLKTCIRQRKIVAEGNLCPFLDEHGLCEIYREYGPDSLSRTCKRHPRHVEDYGNLHEVMLLLSCPEAARLIVTEDWSFHVRENPERMGNTDGIDEKFLNGLLKVRERAFQIMKNRDKTTGERMLRVLSLLHDEQARWMGRRTDGASGGTGKDKLTGTCSDTADSRFFLMADFMAELSELDVVSPKWPGLLEKSRKLLYHSKDSRARYEADRLSFIKENPDAEAYCERIFVYFLYSFLLTALYDNDAYIKGKMAVFCTLAIEDLVLAAWRMAGVRKTGKNGCQGTEDDWKTAGKFNLENEIIRVSYILARQIENSSENRDGLEQILKSREFGIRRMKSAFGV